MHDESHKKFRHPWQRLPPGQGKEGATESARSYQGFQIYFQMDPRERSLRKVAQQLDKSETWIETLSSKFHWRQRTEARDHYQAEIKAAAREKIERDSAEKWALREEQLRELKYEVSQEMITHGRKAIGQPQVRKELRKELGKETEAGCLKQVTASVPSQEGRHLIADGFALIEEAIRSPRRQDGLADTREEFQNELYQPPREEPKKDNGSYRSEENYHSRAGPS